MSHNREPTIEDVQRWLTDLRNGKKNLATLRILTAVGCFTFVVYRFILLLYSVIVLIVLAALPEWNVSQFATAQVLAIEDKRAIPLLLEALTYANSKTKPLIRAALKRLMAVAVRDDGELLARSRDNIEDELEWCRASPAPEWRLEYSLAILQAIKVCKVTNCYQMVKVHLAQARDEAVIEAADECLAALDRQIRQSRDKDSLLRPTSSADESLLRPVSGSSESTDALPRVPDQDDSDK